MLRRFFDHLCHLLRLRLINKMICTLRTIARITGGKFRLLRRLFLQVEWVLGVNELAVVADDVVNAARSNLVIGLT